MMNVLSPLVLAALFLTVAVVAQDDDTCFTNFRDLNTAIEAKNPFDLKTFVVCPNTVINIGARNPNDVTEFVNGDVPILMRQFTRIYCGKDGSVTNNCTIRGGVHQVSITSLAFDNEKKTRMEIKGFTFEDSDSAAILAVYPEGDLLIEDCVFRDHVVPGSVLRALTAENSDPQISFNKCVFDANGIGPDASNVNAGAFDVSSVILSITNSVFSNNAFGSERVRITYLIAADENSSVSLQNNCFFGNDFQTLGVVNLRTQDSIGEISNNFGAKDDDGVRCHFVHIEGGTCVDFDLEECPIAGVNAPPVRKSNSSAERRFVLVSSMFVVALAHYLL